MILPDTSIWIEHFRGRGPRLAGLLENSIVFMHPLIEGELACCNLKDRATILSHLRALPKVRIASDEECRLLLENKKLHGLGVGWLDVHLLASALLTSCELWTLDVVLNTAAKKAGARLRI
jgi:predicted nucleic acid-binding protein